MVRKGCAFFFSLLVLTGTFGIAINLNHHKKEAQARIQFYISILEQAPCIETVCPGFEGREEIFERLSTVSKLEHIVDNGGAPVNFSLASKETEVAGGGAVIFMPDSFEKYDIVDEVYLRIPGLKLETAFEAVGEPDELFFISGCGMGSRVHAKLFYLSRGIEIVVDYATRRGTGEILVNDTSISSLKYFLPENFQDHFIESLRQDIIGSEAYFLPTGVTENDLVAEIHQWPGISASPSPSADYCTR